MKSSLTQRVQAASGKFHRRHCSAGERNRKNRRTISPNHSRSRV
jgi:hypothetical protein